MPVLETNIATSKCTENGQVCVGGSLRCSIHHALDSIGRAINPVGIAIDSIGSTVDPVASFILALLARVDTRDSCVYTCDRCTRACLRFGADPRRDKCYGPLRKWGFCTLSIQHSVPLRRMKR